MPEDKSLLDLIILAKIDDASIPIITSVLAAAGDFYRSFKIPKRNGGSRTIDSPYPSLENIQRQIFENILSSFSAHPSAYAFTRKKNALAHASHHLSCNELITLDIRDFFPSITRQIIIETLNSRGISAGVSNYISLLCCLNNALPQGACTSPTLSNLAFNQLDERFSRLAESLELKYSRYADDLAFSGDRVPRDMPELVQRILDSKGFSLNRDKIRLKVRGAKKIITGVSISSGIPKAPKIFKRMLRAEIFELEKNVDNISQMKTFDPLVYERVLGRLNYLLQIEPQNAFARRKKASLSQHHQHFLSLARNR